MSELPTNQTPDPFRGDAPESDWRPLPNHLLEDERDCSLTRRQARNWELVLQARLIACRNRRYRLGWQLLVETENYQKALSELRAYEQENRGWPPPLPEAVSLVDNRATTLWVLIGLAVFYNVSWQTIPLGIQPPIDWLALGNADAGKMMAGEWWRAVTALTLHNDWPHLLGNLLIGGLFISRLCRDLGSGLGWTLLLAAGFFGNLVNAWLQSPAHRAVGASTAIFGAVGLLAVIGLIRYRHDLRLRRRWPLPLAAAVGLLAMLGAGGENTDLGAHLFGFLAGMVVGVPVGWVIDRRGRPEGLVNAALCLFSLCWVIGSWWLALA